MVSNAKIVENAVYTITGKPIENDFTIYITVNKTDCYTVKIEQGSDTIFNSMLTLKFSNDYISGFVKGVQAIYSNYGNTVKVKDLR